MHGIDPYEPNEPTYECSKCGHRTETRGSCPECGGYARNIEISRE